MIKYTFHNKNVHIFISQQMHSTINLFIIEYWPTECPKT